MKLDSIASCVIQARDEVELQFHEPEGNRDDDAVIQITLHFPSVVQNEDDENEEIEESAAEKFQKKVIEIGVLPSITGNIIVEFTKEQGNFVTPRGKYALQVQN